MNEMEQWLKEHEASLIFYKDRNPAISLVCALHGEMYPFEGQTLEAVINKAQRKEQDDQQWDLKPCPFCQSDQIGFGVLKRGYYCFCKNCLAQTKRGSHKREAAENWNSRS